MDMEDLAWIEEDLVGFRLVWFALLLIGFAAVSICLFPVALPHTVASVRPFFHRSIISTPIYLLPFLVVSVSQFLVFFLIVIFPFLLISYSTHRHSSIIMHVEEPDPSAMCIKSCFPSTSHRPPTIADFELIRVLGQGSFGKVLLVHRNRWPSRWFALKVVDKAAITSDDNIERILLERELLSQLRSPFTCTLFAAFQNDTKLFFLTDLMHMDLCDYIEEHGVLSENTARFYMAELGLALDFLHSRRVLHRDVKLENILIDFEGHVRLTDFGLSRWFAEDECMNTRTIVGTQEYMAPEVLKGDYYSTSIDWWALGVTFYGMFTNELAFMGRDDDDTAARIRKGHYRCLRTVSRSARGLIRSLLNRSRNQRIASLSAFQSHRWFGDLDWTAMTERRVPVPFTPFAEDVGTPSPAAQQMREQLTAPAKETLPYLEDFDFVSDCF